MSNLVHMAQVASKMAHQAIGQKRKYIDHPYYTHPDRVARMVKFHGGTDEMVAAAYLHDVIEDTFVTYEDIFMSFGRGVADLVQGLTDQYVDPSFGNRAKRKELERDRLSRENGEVQTIKYADLIDNTESIVEHDPNFAVVYLKEKKKLLAVMTKGDIVLYNKALDSLTQGETKMMWRAL